MIVDALGRFLKLSGSQNSAIDSHLRIQAARSYSLINPPSTGRRLIRR